MMTTNHSSTTRRHASDVGLWPVICRGEPRLGDETSRQATPSQAAPVPTSVGSRAEGVEATTVTTKDNPSQERPAPSPVRPAGEDMVRSWSESSGEGFNGPRVAASHQFWGNLGLTNLQVAGQLASDQTYVTLALRCWLYFDGTNRRANYLGVASQLYFTLIVGEKPMFTHPCWYAPSGGGIWGLDATASIFNLGEPTQEAILKLARPIIIPVRQNFACQAVFFAVGSTVALDGLNSGATDDQKVIVYMIDGQLDGVWN